ncbi:hypothetical protein ACFLRF_01480 [Candidatus Altiarchaeota archaeon]
MRNVIAIILLAQLISSVSAWDTSTYLDAAGSICDEYDCGCQQVILDSVMLPETLFRDSPRHHCHNDSLQYGNSSIDFWKTPGTSECPALGSMQAWLDRAENESGCQLWRSIGIALHYFMDSQEFWNTVVEANKTCVSEYEEEVGEFIRFGGDEWETCRCGVCMTNAEYKSIIAEYNEKIKLLIDSRHYENPHLTILSNSIEKQNARTLETFLRLKGVNVSWKNASEISCVRADEMILILGGQNSPEGIGQIVSGILTEEEKAQVMTDKLEGKVYTKHDVWAAKQTVIIHAGYDAKNTMQTTLDGRQATLKITQEISKTRAKACTRSDDCGTEYYGIPVCSRGVATRIRYKPSCKLGICTVRSMKAKTRRCLDYQTCITGRGCVATSGLPRRDMKHEVNYSAQISPSRLTIFNDMTARADIIIGNYAWPGRIDCQELVAGEDWKKVLNITHNQKAKYAVNVTGWPRPATVTYRYRLRCGNVTEDKLNITFTPTLNLTVTWVARPLQFHTYTYPASITMDGCKDTAYVNLTVRNLGVKNMTCKAATKVDTVNFRVDVNVTLNKTSRSFEFNPVNHTNYSKLLNINYTVAMEANKTIVEVNYTWRVEPVNSRMLRIRTNDCSITQTPITVTCRDRDGIVGTKKAYIDVIYLDKGGGG